MERECDGKPRGRERGRESASQRESVEMDNSWRRDGARIAPADDDSDSDIDVAEELNTLDARLEAIAGVDCKRGHAQPAARRYTRSQLEHRNVGLEHRHIGHTTSVAERQEIHEEIQPQGHSVLAHEHG